MAEFRMPSLGADMDEATLVRWLVVAGDRVARGQVVAEVETDKGVLDVEVFEDGVVAELVVAEGTRVAVGTVLARIRGEGETAPPGPGAAGGVPAAPVVASAPLARAGAGAMPGGATPGGAMPGGAMPGGAMPGGTMPDGAMPGGAMRGVAAPGAGAPEPAVRGHRRSSPAARVLAETLGVDMTSIEGSGPGGAVTVADVRRAAGEAKAPAGPPAPPAGSRADTEVDAAAAAGRPAVATVATQGEAAARGGPAEAAASRTTPEARAKMRASIAALLSRSKREIPHYYLSHDIDMGAALAWLERRNQQAPVTGRVLAAALLLKAVALAVREVPEMNGFFSDGRFAPCEAVHVGVAVSLKDAGLVAPAIMDVDRRPLGELMAALRDVVSRARSGRLRASEMSAPTITVTNLGDQGVESVFGVIYPPQVALVGFGRISERPPGIAGARPTVTVTLSADHRASDGHRGAVFLNAIDRLLQHPEAL